MPGRHPPNQPSSFPASLLLADANAHAFNRQVLKLIHSKPAALRVVYYKRVFAERSPPDEACTSTVSSNSPVLHLNPTATPGGDHMRNCHHGHTTDVITVPMVPVCQVFVRGVQGQCLCLLSIHLIQC